MLPLVELSEQEIKAIVAQVPGGARNVQDIYPLAPLQEGILFHHLMSAAGDTYVLPTLLRIPSDAELEAFQAALQSVIDRHDILRTAVMWAGLSRPVQVVYRCAHLPVERVQLDDDVDVLAQMRERLLPERQQMDLQHAPLLRLQVARTEQGDWLVLMQLHHLVSDHVALEVVVEEVGAYMEGRASQLDEPQPYREYVAHVLHWARHSDAQRFFSERLSSIEEPSAPFGLVQGTGDDFPIEEVHELLDEQLADRLRTQARQLRMSSASLFHAAWALVVAATSARNTVVFGTVLSGRLQGAAGASARTIRSLYPSTIWMRHSGSACKPISGYRHGECCAICRQHCSRWWRR
jgi:hypothetical protein